jgi:multidrug resistance efflux pump
MIKRIWIFKALAALALSGTVVYVKQLVLRGEGTSAAQPDSAHGTLNGARNLVCTGRVESVRGELEVAALIAGRLEEVRVTEGDRVDEGDILAVLDGAREAEDLRMAEAAVKVAQSRLRRIEAGNGKEEVEQAFLEWKAFEARMAYERSNLGRLRHLYQRQSLASDELERKEREVDELKRSCDAREKHYEALRRGPIPQELELARAELAQAESRVYRARIELGFRTIRAPMTGIVVEVHRHAGDSVNTEYATPILRLADVSRLRVRLEVDEADVGWLRDGLSGEFRVKGASGSGGRLIVKTIVPTFGPKRLFNPDVSARHDSRILTVLCEPTALRTPLYLGQRVTAYLPGEDSWNP